jgi:hypothetical protein
MKGLDRLLPVDHAKPAEDDGYILAVMAMMVGGLMMSRAVEDQEFSDHILRSTRRAAMKLTDNIGAQGVIL